MGSMDGYVFTTHVTSVSETKITYWTGSLGGGCIRI